MNITRDITPDRDVTLTIEIPVDETEPLINKALADFRAQARIPGFRPGKIPMDFIKRRYGRELIAGVIDDLAQAKLKEALEQEKLEPVGRIAINLKEYGEGKPLIFEAHFPLRPEVKLGEYKGLHLLISDAEVTDADVDAQIEGLRRKHANLLSIDDPAPVEALVTVKFHEVHPSGLPLVGRPVEEKQIEFGADSLGSGSDEQLIGIRAGETRLIRVRDAGTGLTGAPQGHNIVSPAEAAGREQTEGLRVYSVEALRVEVPHKPDLDDEFAQFINPGFKTLADLREYSRIMLMGYASQAMHRQMEAAILARLIESNPFPIPRSIITETLSQVADEMKLTGEERSKFIDSHFLEAERDYRWVLLRDEIAKCENIEVTDEEIDVELQHIAERTGEPLEVVVKRFSEDDKREKLRSRIFEGRVLDLLAQNADIEKREVSLMELLRMGE